MQIVSDEKVIHDEHVMCSTFVLMTPGGRPMGSPTTSSGARIVKVRYVTQTF